MKTKHMSGQHMSEKKKERRLRMRTEKGTILRQDCIAKDTYRMVITTKQSADMKPGQFVNLAIPGMMLRRPISICSIDKNSFTIIYKVVGKGTACLSKMFAGETLDVFGPLGNGYVIEEKRSEVLLIGGGAGVPPLYELAKRYVRAGAHVDVVLGFNDASSVFYEGEFHALGCDVAVATMDGSYGYRGTVLDAIDQEGIMTSFICACGPLPMLKALQQRYRKGYFSLEARMACGMGACMACVAKDAKEADMYHRICKEGPVFEIGKVVLE